MEDSTKSPEPTMSSLDPNVFPFSGVGAVSSLASPTQPDGGVDAEMENLEADLEFKPMKSAIIANLSRKSSESMDSQTDSDRADSSGSGPARASLGDDS